jgi:hypothetical protein
MFNSKSRALVEKNRYYGRDWIGHGPMNAVRGSAFLVHDIERLIIGLEPHPPVVLLGGPFAAPRKQLLPGAKANPIRINLGFVLGNQITSDWKC